MAVTRCQWLYAGRATHNIYLLCTLAGWRPAFIEPGTQSTSHLCCASASPFELCPYPHATLYARYACVQQQFAPYCHASTSLFEVCPNADESPYACSACMQEQFAPYCCASASPFEVCPGTAAHEPYNCSSHSYNQFNGIYH